MVRETIGVMKMRDRIHDLIEKNFDDVYAVCNSIYKNPETALQEFETVAKIKKLLRDKGFEVEENCAGLETAFKAVKKSGEGPRFAIPVEYDALPGIGHACGHHLIAAMSLLAGIAIGELIEELGGEVALFGTPGEETGEGKPPMVQAGYFDGYDAAAMIHGAPISYVTPDITSIGVYDIKFTGKTAHCGASPELGVNSLDAVVQMYNAVSMMRQQMKEGTKIAGIVLEGGDMTNSIPDSCVCRYEIRTTSMDYYDHVADRLRKCAEAAALATGCKLDFWLSMPICNSMKHNEALAEVFREIMAEYGEAESKEKPTPFATDMGDVSQVIPSLHPIMKVSDGGELLHTKEFLEAAGKPYAWERTKINAEMLAMLGIRVLTDKTLLDRLKNN